MKLYEMTAVGIAATLLLAGCSPASTEAVRTEAVRTAIASTTVVPATSDAAPLTASPTPTRDVTVRGELIKEIGQESSWGYDDTGITLHFKVTSIAPIECDRSGVEPSGMALAIGLEISTDANFFGPLEVNGVDGQISFGSHYWRGYEPDGTRMNSVDTSAANNCLQDRGRLIPDYFGKGEKLKGIVILDVTTPSGTIVFDPAGGDGWAWKY
ncbi:hypothetical protein [Arthrobacter dokdonensis]|uniref:hypothetical protein n=1 Tax=Arthrobacter dokdonellae TaxID=2211210 RepID=UPI001013C506|nr:hypothetical protein [Arthrobacter dokdonellae]